MASVGSAALGKPPSTTRSRRAALPAPTLGGGSPTSTSARQAGWPARAVGQHRVEHRGLVHNGQAGVEQVGLVRVKLSRPSCGLTSSRRWTVCANLDASLRRLTALADGAGNATSTAGVGQPDHRAQGDGLAGAGAAGQDGQRRVKAASTTASSVRQAAFLGYRGAGPPVEIGRPSRSPPAAPKRQAIRRPTTVEPESVDGVGLLVGGGCTPHQAIPGAGVASTGGKHPRRQSGCPRHQRRGRYMAFVAASSRTYDRPAATAPASWGTPNAWAICRPSEPDAGDVRSAGKIGLDRCDGPLAVLVVNLGRQTGRTP